MKRALQTLGVVALAVMLVAGVVSVIGYGLNNAPKPISSGVVAGKMVDDGWSTHLREYKITIVDRNGWCRRLIVSKPEYDLIQVGDAYVVKDDAR